MYKFICSIILFTIFSISTSTLPCPTIKLLHGRVKYRNKMQQAKFVCSKMYILAGERFAVCRKGNWDNPRPVCVRTTCPKVNPPPNGILYPAYGGGVINFYCEPGYKIRGPSSSYCDGEKWNTSLPACLLSDTTPSLSCDFETSDLCGWTQDMNHNFDWKRENYESPRGHVDTGPKYDHSKGLGGYYMYIESASRKENDTARLISPIYNKNENGFCFQFYYHMYGVGIGQLRVYVKKESETYDTKKLTPHFIRRGNQGDAWQKGWVYIETMEENYQIIIEGIRGTHIESDIAIDDVKITDYCEDFNQSSTTNDYSTSEIPVYESCENRCGQNGTNFTNSDDLYLISCDCSDSCMDNNTCCSDYVVYCILDSSTDVFDATEFTTAVTVTDKVVIPVQTTTMSPTTTKATALTTTKTTTPTSTKTMQITTNKAQPTTRRLTTFSSTKAPVITTRRVTTAKPTTKPTIKSTQQPLTTKLNPNKNKIAWNPSKNDNTIFKENKTKLMPTKSSPKVEPTTAFVEPTEETVPTLAVETDYEGFSTSEPKIGMILNNAQIYDVKSGNENMNLILGIICSLVFLMGLVLSVFLVHKKYNLNCKRFQNTRYSESMSDVRFLAGDEVLDFTWQKPE